MRKKGIIVKTNLNLDDECLLSFLILKENDKEKYEQLIRSEELIKKFKKI